jgi:hypothetical protein
MAALLLSFSIYAHIFFTKPESSSTITQISKIQNVEFTFKGMTCSSCEYHVKLEISKLIGISEVMVSYEKGYVNC